MSALKRTFSFINQHPLAKKHLFKSYFNFLNWQFKKRINRNLQPIKFIGETYFLAKSGLTGITGNIYTGLHEFNEMGFLLHFLRSEDTFFDVGANVGSYTLLAAGTCKSKTIAFEPIVQTFDILLQNVEINRLENLVQLENKGLGKEIGIINFVANEDTTNHVATDQEQDALTNSVSITFLDNYNNYNPALIKIDVEGYETQVLDGARNLLSNPILKAIIIELNGSGERYGFDENQIHAQLISHSFKPYNYDPFERKLTELETFGQFNTIYLRDTDFVENRLRSSKGFTVYNELI